jgi:RNA polymerase sigma factor (TIGR02999 family)
MSDVTRILESIRRGDSSATDELLPVVYEELRRIAAQRLSHEALGHTLQPTALVHEAYLRLVGSASSDWENRAHFFAAAAEAMRRILIESARARQRLKRAPGGERFELSEHDRIVLPIAADLLDLNEALARLEQAQPEKANVVKLKFFAGMTLAEIATALEISTATVERHWTYARAWLHRELQK